MWDNKSEEPSYNHRSSAREPSEDIRKMEQKLEATSIVNSNAVVVAEHKATKLQLKEDEHQQQVYRNAIFDHGSDLIKQKEMEKQQREIEYRNCLLKQIEEKQKIKKNQIDDDNIYYETGIVFGGEASRMTGHNPAENQNKADQKLKAGETNVDHITVDGPTKLQSKEITHFDGNDIEKEKKEIEYRSLLRQMEGNRKIKQQTEDCEDLDTGGIVFDGEKYDDVLWRQKEKEETRKKMQKSLEECMTEKAHVKDMLLLQLEEEDRKFKNHQEEWHKGEVKEKLREIKLLEDREKLKKNAADMWEMEKNAHSERTVLLENLYTHINENNTTDFGLNVDKQTDNIEFGHALAAQIEDNKKRRLKEKENN